jgi:hypothetical protein
MISWPGVSLLMVAKTGLAQRCASMVHAISRYFRSDPEVINSPKQLVLIRTSIAINHIEVN